ncbi:MAG: exodeoxyribonuclease VII small subunit [Actinomycetales bacterium]|nr:exodeoxyribonuclease VII small subunit [Actinomycetales bacterium]
MSADKSKTTANADIAAMSYEEARDELAKVVSQLEQGAVSLEDSMNLWERGEALAKQCEEWLSGARKRLDAALANKKSAE